MVATEASSITYDCPNCETHYVIWDESKGPISSERHNDLSEMVRKQYDDVGTCKFCVRKDPNIPTTAEMDGLLTIEDIRNRHKVMKQCVDCNKWTQQHREKPDKPCHNCGGNDFDMTSMKSLRTFNPMTDGKRKVKSKKKK